MRQATPSVAIADLARLLDMAIPTLAFRLRKAGVARQGDRIPVDTGLRALVETLARNPLRAEILRSLDAVAENNPGDMQGEYEAHGVGAGPFRRRRLVQAADDGHEATNPQGEAAAMDPLSALAERLRAAEAEAGLLLQAKHQAEQQRAATEAEAERLRRKVEEAHLGAMRFAEQAAAAAWETAASRDQADQQRRVAEAEVARLQCTVEEAQQQAARFADQAAAARVERAALESELRKVRAAAGHLPQAAQEQTLDAAGNHDRPAGKGGDGLWSLVQRSRIRIAAFVLGSLAVVHYLLREPAPIALFLTFEGWVFLAAVFAVARRGAWADMLLGWPLTLSIFTVHVGKSGLDSSARWFQGAYASPPALTAHLCTWLLVYWTLYYLVASLNDAVEAREEQRHELMPVVGWVLSAWGATLQIAFLSLHLLVPLIGEAAQEEPLATVLRTILHTTPLFWVPGYLFGGGMVFLLAAWFARRPFRPTPSSEILPIASSRSLFIVVVASTGRLPLWILVNVLGFAGACVAALLASLREIADVWLGRLLLLGVSLVGPTAGLLCAHSYAWAAFVRVAQEVTSPDQSVPLTATLGLLASVHMHILLALVIYCVATAAFTLPFSFGGVHETVDHIARWFSATAQVAIESMVGSLGLLGIVLLLVPVDVVFFGGRAPAFAGAYGTVLGLLALLHYWRSWTKTRH